MLDRHGVEVAVLQVVIARPGDLHRRAVHRLGQHGRFDHEVGLGFAAEAAAEQRDVHRDVLERQAQSLGDAVARGLRRLRRAPRPRSVPSTMRAVAAGGSIVACAKCGT